VIGKNIVLNIKKNKKDQGKNRGSSAVPFPHINTNKGEVMTEKVYYCCENNQIITLEKSGSLFIVTWLREDSRVCRFEDEVDLKDFQKDYVYIGVV
jgi:hypothetical protein